VIERMEEPWSPYENYEIMEDEDSQTDGAGVMIEVRQRKFELLDQKSMNAEVNMFDHTMSLTLRRVTEDVQVYNA